jgi:hypothetical protein
VRWLCRFPPGRGNMADEPSFSCSFYCEMAEDEGSTEKERQAVEARGEKGR